MADCRGRSGHDGDVLRFNPAALVIAPAVTVAVIAGTPHAQGAVNTVGVSAGLQAAKVLSDSMTVGRLPERWTGRSLTRLPTHRKVVAMTFDGGANAAGVRPILRSLSRHDVAATFFVTGDFARGHRAEMRRIVAAGHRVANHSVNHPDFQDLSTRQRVRQIRTAGRQITAITGRTPAPWFRFPFGSYDQAAVRTANDLGYAVMGWTVDTLGWMGTSGGQSVRSVTRKVMAGARPGAIMMMHLGSNPDDGSTLDAKALPRTLSKLKAAGYGFVTLDEVLAARS